MTTVPLLGMPEVTNVNMSAIAQRAIIVTKSSLGQQDYYRNRTVDEGRDAHRNVMITVGTSRGQSSSARVRFASEIIFIALSQSLHDCLKCSWDERIFQEWLGRRGVVKPCVILHHENPIGRAADTVMTSAITQGPIGGWEADIEFVEIFHGGE